jgi:hypothetical protein
MRNPDAAVRNGSGCLMLADTSADGFARFTRGSAVTRCSQREARFAVAAHFGTSETMRHSERHHTLRRPELGH